jgi:hypothetical protein
MICFLENLLVFFKVFFLYSLQFYSELFYLIFLLGTESRVIPLQFLHFVTSLFVDIFIIKPCFQSFVISPVLHIFLKIGHLISTVVSVSPLSISG